MFINIMVATVAADPAVALKPRDHFVPVGFRLQHGCVLCANICAFGDVRQAKIRH